MKTSMITDPSFRLFLLYSALSLFTSSKALDTINTTQIIRDGDTLLSSRQTFELGFFSPGKSTNRYLGIWYTNISIKTTIWIANRAHPLRRTSSGALTLLPSGHLTILDKTNNLTVWSSNTSTPSKNPILQLLDSGNLVIRESNDELAENPLWQSFDYPSDTIPQGMDFGWNLLTGWERFISSWTSPDDPSPGSFTAHLEITGYPQIVVRKNDEVAYRIGHWNGIGFSRGARPRQNKPTSTAGLYMNRSAVYYREDAVDASVVSRITLSSSGEGQRLTWMDQSREWASFYSLPADVCDTYKYCGKHGVCDLRNSVLCGCMERFEPRDEKGWGESNWSGGCVRRAELNCVDDVFLGYSGIKMPDVRFTWYNRSLNLKECEDVCVRKCNCTAYSSLDVRNGGSGCLIWFGDLVDIRELSVEDQVIYIRMAASESDRRDSKGMKRATLVIVLTLLAAILLLVPALILLLWKWKNKYQDLRKGEGLEENNKDESMELPMYDLSTVAKATNGFSTDNKLGEGGFGPVYKGILEDGKVIAVKRLSKTSSQGDDEFKNEVVCISKLQHRNLVKLLGCCIQGQEKMLIYEYMPNKSLDVLLFDKAKGKQLDWKTRFHIINGIARGLLYLHQDSRLRVIHRDLKASNVLLDNEMNPKISDFGMAKIFGGNETEANTNRVVGTYGYMSPEYAGDGLFSIKSDVYSFGVLLLEIVNGQRSRGFHHTDHNHNLLGHAWILYKEGRSFELVDPDVSGSGYMQELLRSIHVGLLCVQQHPDDRPSMSSVVVMLGGGGVLPEPKQPGFFARRNETASSETTSSSTYATRSLNQCTITLVEAR